MQDHRSAVTAFLPQDPQHGLLRPHHVDRDAAIHPRCDAELFGERSYLIVHVAVPGVQADLAHPGTGVLLQEGHQSVRGLRGPLLRMPGMHPVEPPDTRIVDPPEGVPLPAGRRAGPDELGTAEVRVRIVRYPAGQMEVRVGESHVGHRLHLSGCRRRHSSTYSGGTSIRSATCSLVMPSSRKRWHTALMLSPTSTMCLSGS